MRVAVVGAGAWGLPAAAHLALRGHDVTLIEAFELGHSFGSSAGDSRIWRVSHPDALMVRLAIRAVAAWRELEAASDTKVLVQRGILWRGSSAPDVAAALAAEGQSYTEVAAADVARFFPGLRPTAADALWQADAGTVLADVSLAAHAALVTRHGGTVLEHTRLTELGPTAAGVRLTLDGGQRIVEVDSVVLALGPWTSQVLPQLDVAIELAPVLEQVTYFGGGEGVATDALPAFYDAPTDTEPGLYAMPVPGRGYKLGLDDAIGAFISGSRDRTPNSRRTAAIAARVERDFGALVPTALDSKVCSWTDSPDGRFIIDQLWDGRVVLACGDSGTGFKFSALLGSVLADLATGGQPDADVATFGLARFADPNYRAPSVRHLQ